jgi:uncharacterized protein (DUF2267 family)
MTNRNRAVLILAGASVIAVVAASRACSARWPVKRFRSQVRRRAHRVPGKLRGIDYRLRGHHPDEDVSDLVLADRIRSSIGPLEKELDLPHIHVMVNDRVVMLHGEVATPDDVERLDDAINDIPGVKGIESFLHVGLLPSDTRPSTGHSRPQPPSDAHKRFMASALHAGAQPGPTSAVRAVLSTFCERIPPAEREHLLGHLPHDVRRLAEPPRRRGTQFQRMRHASDLFDAVTHADPQLTADTARAVTLAVLTELVRLVPEEVSDVEANLPDELRQLWRQAEDVVARDDCFTIPEILRLERS